MTKIPVPTQAEIDLWEKKLNMPVIQVFSNFGMAFLFFLAGFEINFHAIRGRPMTVGGPSEEQPGSSSALRGR